MLLPRQNPAVVFCEVEDGAVLLSTEAEVYYGLNPVGVRVWLFLTGGESTLTALCAQLAAEYPDADPEEIRSDVTGLLADLEQAGLLLPV